jgi:hypothetical protein
MLWKFLIILTIVLLVLVAYSLCVVAGRADDIEEELRIERLKKNKKCLAAGTAGIVAVMCVSSGCSENNGYENLGSEREVSSQSSSDSSQSYIETGKQELSFFDDFLNSGAGYYEGVITKDNEITGKKTETNCSISIDSSKNLKIELENKNIHKILLWNNSSQQLIDVYDSSTGYEILNMHAFNSIKTDLCEYIINAVQKNNMIEYDDENDTAILYFDNDKVLSSICAALDSVNDNYDYIYNKTKDDTEFNSYVENIAGEDFDISLGIPRSCLNTLTEAYAMTAKNMLFVDADVMFLGGVSFEKTNGLAVSIDYSVEDEIQDVIDYTGTLTFTKDDSTVIEFPENIVTDTTKAESSESED